MTARDSASSWEVVEAYSRSTAGATNGILGQLRDRLPFPVKAIPVHGGSEFQAEFEDAFAEQGVHLFVVPARFPRPNRHVERAQPTHKEASYAYGDGALDLVSLNKALPPWERVSDAIRPRDSLGRKLLGKELQQRFPA